MEGVSHEAFEFDKIDPYGDWTINDQNDGYDILLTEEDLIELERVAKKET